MRFNIHHHHHVDQALEHKLGCYFAMLGQQVENIMTKISEFADQMKAFSDRQEKAVSDLQDDVKFLTDKIAELQNSAGQITPEDQASLDALQARASAISDKLDALDALTPPVVPPAA